MRHYQEKPAKARDGNPLDSWAYPELIWKIKPAVIGELGNRHGGTALATGHLLDHLGPGKVLAVDINHDQLPDVVRTFPRIVLITGDTCGSFEEVRQHRIPGVKALVIEGNPHTYQNTLDLMRAYGPLVSAGSYTIVEDSSGHHDRDEGFSLVPYEVLETSLSETRSFEVDRSRKPFMITENPMRFFKKVW